MIARSTLAQWVGQTGVHLQPLVDALREATLAEGVIHADETPVKMLAPGEKKTRQAYGGPTAPRRSRHSKPLFTTSAQVGRAGMRGIFSALGAAR